MITLDFGSVSEAVLFTPRHVTERGIPLNVGGLICFEVRPLSITVRSLECNAPCVIGRNLNPRFLLAEPCWIAGGSRHPWIYQTNKALQDFTDLDGAYGPYVAWQWDGVIDRIRRDPNTRRAVLTIYDGKRNDPHRVTNDTPCTVALQLLRTNRLNMVVTMRSSDSFLGLPYDLFTFSMLLKAAALELHEEVGELTLVCGSSHVYGRDLDKIDKMTEAVELTGVSLTWQELREASAIMEHEIPEDWWVTEFIRGNYDDQVNWPSSLQWLVEQRRQKSEQSKRVREEVR